MVHTIIPAPRCTPSSSQHPGGLQMRPMVHTFIPAPRRAADEANLSYTTSLCVHVVKYL
ncbi:hypothetical protein I79_016732 [Cricetulus griseus]|uniref:Uncharacterized protein n=1 Tax=Cricetulus griseus TaxID=10029 RepID=G3I056_CRIGR|nr:hypothetical protein I79_016732 [Cricetulus griseus]